MSTRKKKKIIMSWCTYVVICIYLAIMNYFVSPSYPWVLWVVGGWGLGQILITIEYILDKKYGADE